MIDLIELVWPTLSKDPTREAALAAEEATALLAISGARWPKNEALILGEALRLEEAESERRRSTDNKAAIYLAALAAVLPLIASTETIVWDNSIRHPPPAMSLPLFALTLVYLGMAGLWSIRVLRVSELSRVDVDDLLVRRTTLAIAKEHLKAIRLTRKTVNDKLSKLKMAHEFILRAAFTFGILLLAEAAWGPAVGLLEVTQARIARYERGLSAPSAPFDSAETAKTPSDPALEKEGGPALRSLSQTEAGPARSTNQVPKAPNAPVGSGHGLPRTTIPAS